jgi:hypothetical protein
MCGDLSNFLNLYYNLDNFRSYIKQEYPEKYKIINELNKDILEKCNFPFLKRIDKNCDFQMIENKLVKYFINNIDIKDKIYGNEINELFTNNETIELFKKMQTINYDIYIKFIKLNEKKEFGQRKNIIQKTEIFLNDVYQKIEKEGKIPRIVKNNIYSDLYKNLINYSISTKNSKKVMLYFTNYLTELNIQQYDILINKYFEDKDLNQSKLEINNDSRKV